MKTSDISMPGGQHELLSKVRLRFREARTTHPSVGHPISQFSAVQVFFVLTFIAMPLKSIKITNSPLFRIPLFTNKINLNKELWHYLSQLKKGGAF